MRTGCGHEMLMYAKPKSTLTLHKTFTFVSFNVRASLVFTSTDEKTHKLFEQIFFSIFLFI